MTALESLHAAYRDREAHARAAKAAGRKIVGYLSNNFPEELALAAGLVAVQLTGDPSEPTPIADRYLDEVFDGHVKSLFERLFNGHFDYCDLVVIPRTSEAFLQLYYFVEAARAWEPERHPPQLYLFDLLNTPFLLTNRYDRKKLDQLRAKLEALAGKPIAADALKAAIATVNADRRQLAEAAPLWRGPQPKLSGVDSLAVIGSAWFIDRAAHTSLLRTLIADAASMPPRSGPRLMVKGSPHDNAGFYTLAEQSGATIVASDHVWGDPTFTALVDEAFDPMEALTNYYQLHSPSIRSYPQFKQDEKFMALVEQAGVQGVVFFHDEHDDTLGWDYPVQRKQLEAKGIPSLFLKKQSYRHPNRAQLTAALGDFVRSIR